MLLIYNSSKLRADHRIKGVKGQRVIISWVWCLHLSPLAGAVCRSRPCCHTDTGNCQTYHPPLRPLTLTPPLSSSHRRSDIIDGQQFTSKLWKSFQTSPSPYHHWLSMLVQLGGWSPCCSKSHSPDLQHCNWIKISTFFLMIFPNCNCLSPWFKSDYFILERFLHHHH